MKLQLPRIHSSKYKYKSFFKHRFAITSTDMIIYTITIKCPLLSTDLITTIDVTIIKNNQDYHSTFNNTLICTICFQIEMALRSLDHFRFFLYNFFKTNSISYKFSLQLIENIFL